MLYKIHLLPTIQTVFTATLVESAANNNIISYVFCYYFNLCIMLVLAIVYLGSSAVEANKQVSNNISRYHVQCNIS